ncbi:MAG: short-chain dehydrogenase/reductase [Ilumatobacteraceae bacterium]|nr:short-chain dehydrogenase/reductase [Ilumatobacteraceae bacterium]
MNADSFRFDGKRALVVGGATGMGAATAALVQELGAEVVVMDFAEITQPGVTSISLDLRSKDSIDAAIDACGGPIDALFSCAGVADGVPGIEKINFLGHRHLIERAIGAGMLRRGSAIGMISSTAGLAWEKNLEELKDYLDTPDFDAGVEWVASRQYKADYMWSKQAVCAYVARQALTFIKQGIRINAILPGPTDTPLARSQADLWLGFGADYRAEAGVEASTAEEQAGPLAFLCSPAASQINGIIMIADSGYISSGITGSFPDATPAVDFLYGRY